MALTLSPTNLGTEGASLSPVSGEDPTYLEVPSRETCLLIAINNSGIEVLNADFTKYPTDLDHAGEVYDNLFVVGDSLLDGEKGFIVLDQTRAENIIDFSQSPPRAEITGNQVSSLDFIYVSR